MELTVVICEAAVGGGERSIPGESGTDEGWGEREGVGSGGEIGR